MEKSQLKKSRKVKKTEFSKWRKTPQQTNDLVKFYKKKIGSLNKEEWCKKGLRRIALATRLSVSQVYKWMWDRRNQEVPNKLIDDVESVQAGTQEYQRLEVNNIKMMVPLKAISPVSITVEEGAISHYAEGILRREAWQLIGGSIKNFELQSQQVSVRDISKDIYNPDS